MGKFELPQIPVEVLQTWPSEAQQYITALQTQLQLLQQHLAGLKAALNQISQNSGKPPSQDPPFSRPPKKTKAKTGQPKGAQVGHPKHQR